MVRATTHGRRKSTQLLALASGLSLGIVIGLDAWVDPAAFAATRPEAGRDAERRAILFYTAEVHGAVEPCGCTSDPLGDVSRLVALVEDARKEVNGSRR
ncbi:MAG: hypothetical protein H7X95_12275, partial [Deltaproteobacteria bacterium]|nr:hypothetical protein [Deltaproteobacteria bacterium]